MNPNSTVETQKTPSWQYVSVASYQPPSAPVTYSARERYTSFRRLFQRSKPEQDGPLISTDKLLSLPLCQLDRLAPAPVWQRCAEALDSELKDWLQQEDPTPPVIVMVGPPHSGNIETLEAWAEIHAWRTLKGPTPEQILAGDTSWFAAQIGDGSPWVLPALENLYLRHVEGLKLLRHFLDLACAGQIGQGIIGCDSWAWAFISHLWHGRTPTTLTLQAFDEPRLAAHFQPQISECNSSPLLFRLSDTGHYVLPAPEIGEKPNEYSKFLQILAAHSRGILGVAQAIWRTSMQAEPDEKLSEEDENTNNNIPHHTVWIIPWNQLKLPVVPAKIGHGEAFILHALLLHNGLPYDLLKLLLPTSQGMENIYWLEEEGLVTQNDTVWKVTAQGYPAARQFLQSNGYLVDQF
ncbi:hypothetical protein [Desulforhopalus sp. IMCC35007]|uniref:hypothetical protein n=1 Tax=Desulforhopalus sp. IMCC35007 TaxID=2569543 RepID=UPI0010AEB727|nr:hypothetical protein [Desulforhopalus sp. IMCC35007]TKB10402.1 hypothetical protein FCL48_07600 [Desulforhopalus sp. IMCC35007]